MSIIYISDVPSIAPFGFWTECVSTPIIVLIGIIGNTLSFVVMKSNTLRHKSYAHYLCVLAVFDTLTLVTRQVESVNKYFISGLGEPGLFEDFSAISCKFYKYVTHVITVVSSWLVVLMAIERLLAVCFPFKKVAIRQQSGADIAIGVMFILICISQLYHFVMVDHVLYGFHDCLAGNNYLSIYTSLNVYYQWALVFCFPVVFILVCNSMVLYQIFKVRQDVCQNNHPTRYNRAVERKKRCTCMLLTVTFSYIVTLLPLFMLTLVLDIAIKSKDKETAGYMYITLMPYLDICSTIALLNYATNFFIYVLSEKRFRFELRKLCKRSLSVKRCFPDRRTRDDIIWL